MQKRIQHALNTFMLVVAMGLILSLVAWILAGTTGIFAALIFLCLLWIAIPAVPGHFILRSLGCKCLHPSDVPELYQVLNDLTRRAGLSYMPQLWIDPSRQINASAAGQGHNAAISLSAGSLAHLDLNEIRAILAHEIGHILAGDTNLTRLSELVRIVTGLFAIVGTALCVVPMLTGIRLDIPVIIPLILAIAPWGLLFLSARLSRERELAADAMAADLCGSPLWLARALTKIGRFSGKARSPMWLDSHPPISARLQALGCASQTRRFPASPVRHKNCSPAIQISNWKRRMPC